jgi:hypothetical protein
VKAACDHISSTFPEWHDSHVVQNLFTAYRAMALLGHKKEALAELKRINEEFGSTLKSYEKDEYEKQLSESAKW